MVCFVCRPWTSRSVCARAEQPTPRQEDAPRPPSEAQEAVVREEEVERSTGLKPGQGTAIVTGAISVILGVAYIALTILLDSRGELLPPPPEAFMQ
jgi:hypothetical protein